MMLAIKKIAERLSEILSGGWVLKLYADFFSRDFLDEWMNDWFCINISFLDLKQFGDVSLLSPTIN